MLDIYFQTETKWEILIDENGDAIHNIEIKVLNPEARYPVTNILFDLPPSGMYTDFITSVDGEILPTGKGYIPASKRYILTIGEIVKNNLITTIAISFKHQRAVTNLGETSLVIWPFRFNLHGSVTMEVILPPLNWFEKVITWIYRTVKWKKPYYEIHNVVLPPMAITPSKTDEKEGCLRYYLESDSLTLGFAYQSYSKVTVFSAISAILGLIYAIIITIAKIP